jgi:hypothetical protein
VASYERRIGILTTRPSDAVDACDGSTARKSEGLTRQRPDAVTIVTVRRFRRATVPVILWPSSVSNSTTIPTENLASWVRLLAERNELQALDDALIQLDQLVFAQLRQVDNHKRGEYTSRPRLASDALRRLSRSPSPSRRAYRLNAAPMREKLRDEHVLITCFDGQRRQSERDCQRRVIAE